MPTSLLDAAHAKGEKADTEAKDDADYGDNSDDDGEDGGFLAPRNSFASALAALRGDDPAVLMRSVGAPKAKAKAAAGAAGARATTASSAVKTERQASPSASVGRSVGTASTEPEGHGGDGADDSAAVARSRGRPRKLTDLVSAADQVMDELKETIEKHDSDFTSFLIVTGDIADTVSAAGAKALK